MEPDEKNNREQSSTIKIASGLTSNEILKNHNIPFVDDGTELELICRNEKNSDSNESIPVRNGGNYPVYHKREKNIPSGMNFESKTPCVVITEVCNRPSSTSTVDTYQTASEGPDIRNSLTSECQTDISGTQESQKFIDLERRDEIMDSRKASLRRNSVSMPELSDLQLDIIRQQYLDNQPDKFKYRSPLWIESESDISSSSRSEHSAGSQDSRDSIQSSGSSINDFLDQQIAEHHQSQGSGFSDGDNTAEETQTLTDDEREKSPARTGRRKTGIGLRRSKERSEFSMDEDYSPSNSVTSINSLASLLREKLHNIPTKIRKKPKDYKLKAFVAIMFLAVAFFIGFAYVMFHQQAMAKPYFNSIKLNKVKRIIKFYNRDDVEILTANFGATSAALDPSSKAYPCLPEFRKNDGSVCLEWTQGLRFYINHHSHDPGMDNTTCYSIHWVATSEGIWPTDCFDLTDSKTHWYGGGISYNISWPLDVGSVEMSPFITGDTHKRQWGNVLARYFINSKGAAIVVDDDSPLHVSINQDQRRLCIQGRHDDFAYVNHFHPYTELKYNICTSFDMRSLHCSIHNHQRTPLWDGLKPDDMSTLDSLLSEPVWQIAPQLKHELTEDAIYKYTEDVIGLGFLKQGHVLINEYWQNNIGDFILDLSRFETLNETINVMHRRGFKIVFTIMPFISTDSINFGEAVRKRLLVTERNSDKRIPALTRYKSMLSAGVLDITNNRTVPWILEKLKPLWEDYKINSFYLDLGTAHDMPHYYQCENMIVNPDQFKTILIKRLETSLSLIGVSSAVTLPRPHIFVSLPKFESSWEGIKQVIPTILTYGISGYPFILPGAIGGDTDPDPLERNFTSDSSIEQKNSTLTAQMDRELYIRWLQLATFLPVMKFTHPPNIDEKLLEMAKNLSSLRQKTVVPLLLKYKAEALEEGLPLIRPLWLAGGMDGGALLVDDEFAVGAEIIVAPILEKGGHTREVYLPGGIWKDGIDGSLRKGNRWIHNYSVPAEKIAYFLKMDDNTRF